MTAASDVAKAFSRILAKVDSPDAMRKLGGFIIRTIRERTRGRAQGVSAPGGNATRLKRVGDKYAKWRAKQPRHPDAATGRTSNLTFKGKMLDAMIVKKATATKLFIGFRTQKEADKAVWQEQQGRRFLVLSGKEIKDAAAFVKQGLRGR
jgi:hypothetical protein